MSHVRRAALGTVMASFEGPDVPAWLVTALQDGLGSICLFGSNLAGPGRAIDDETDASVRAVTQAIHAQSAACLVALDEEGGDVTRLDPDGSPLPSAAALGAVDDEALTGTVAEGLGARLLAAGVDLDLAPVLDVNSAADNPVIGVRSFGATPDLVARHGAATVTGLRSGGVATCVKHFPGHGDAHEDSHVAAPHVLAELGTLRTRELVPFAAAVAAGTDAVMTAHLVLPALDAAQPATTSPAVLAILRDELGFGGVVVTDALDMAGASGPAAHGSLGAAAVAALAAGADLLCLGADKRQHDLDEVVRALTTAVADGRVSLGRLTEAADRVSRLGERCRVRRERLDRVQADRMDRRGRAAGAAAARRALRVEGSVPPGLQAGTDAHVVRLLDDGNAAAGATPWGIAAPLAGRRPGITAADVSVLDDPEQVARAAAGRALVLAVRDLHRRPDATRWLAQVLERRPDAVVVDLGWPAAASVPAACRVTTYGASRASAEALADLLAGAR